MDLVKKKRKRNIKIIDDGFNTVLFKPNNNKVVIGINVGSWGGARYRSFNCKTEKDAKRIGIDYINKKSRKKIK